MRDETEDKLFDTYTAEELAPLLRVSVARVYDLARTRRIPVIRLGRQVRFPKSRLREWMQRGGTDD